MKKVPLILFCIFGLGFAAYRFYDYRTTVEGRELRINAPRPKKAPRPSARSLDVDAMAARMRDHQEVYRKLRDDTLAAYNKRNPVHGEFFPEAERAIKLASYLWVWGDYYEEGLVQACAASADQACYDSDPNDPLMQMLYRIYDFEGRHGTSDDENILLMKECDDFGNSEYPAPYKFMFYGLLMKDFSAGKQDKRYTAGLPKTIALLPGFPIKMGEYFKTLSLEKTPDIVLFRQSSIYFNEIEEDGEILAALGTAFDKALEAADPEGPLRPAVQADFQISYAWNARGSGWASSVTDEGWKLMKERLAKASDILEYASLKHPEVSYLPRLMITVELGQGAGRRRMEDWFQRAVDVDPNDRKTYERKMYYLKPRWHGSIQDMATFGNECIATENWQSGIPMIAMETVEDIAENKPDIYANPDVWKMVEGLYDAYLERYPESTIRRGEYMKAAAAGGHWEIARKQLDLLGVNWDHHSIDRADFEKLKAQIEKETAVKSGGNSQSPRPSL